MLIDLTPVRASLSRLLTAAVLCALLSALLSACAPGAAPTPTPTPTPAAGDDWRIYVAAGGQVQFAYPPAWTETAPGRLSGADGFASLELRESAGAGPGALCQAEANRGKPGRYGSLPEIRDLQINAQPACLILPSAGQPAGRGEALLLVWLPAPTAGERDLLWLRADSAHITAIAGSLSLPQAAAPLPSACDFSPAAQPVETIYAGGLGVDFIPLADAANCDAIQQSADFYPYIDAAPVTQRLGHLRTLQSDSSRLNRLNAHLRPYDLHVETYDEGLFRLRRGAETLRENISWIGPFSALEPGGDFILPLLDGYNATAYLAGPRGVEPLDDPDLLVFDNVFPVIAGGGRVRLAYDTQTIPRAPSTPAVLRVNRDGQEIDAFSISGASPAGAPVRGLWSWQDSWVVQLPGLVIQDGEILNQRLGCAEIFGWRLLREKPFYLCRQDGSIHASYNGHALPFSFEAVIHEPQIGSAALLQMRGYESGLAFLARRQGLWVYVIIEAQ